MAHCHFTKTLMDSPLDVTVYIPVLRGISVRPCLDVVAIVAPERSITSIL